MLTPKNHQSSTESCIPAKAESFQILSDLFYIWLDTLDPKLKESTYSLYQRHIENHIAPCVGAVPFSQLTDQDVLDFVKLKGTLAPKTIRSILGILSSVLSYAKDLDLITTNPCCDIKLPKLPKSRVNVFSKQEQKLIEEVCDIGIWLCLYTGIRVGELCALQWRDIDFDYGMLHVSKTLQRIKDMPTN